MTGIKKSDIINPVHPNRATLLFGGVASGILNWNDLKYPVIYKLREEIRATFWQAAEFTVTRTNLDMSHAMTLYQKYQYYIGELLDYASDPSVKSVMSTMLDQNTEAMLLLNDVSTTDKASADAILNIDSITNVVYTLKELYGLTEDISKEVSDLSSTNHDVIDKVLTDLHNHANFWATVHNVTLSEHSIDSAKLEIKEERQVTSTDLFDDL